MANLKQRTGVQILFCFFLLCSGFFLLPMKAEAGIHYISNTEGCTVEEGNKQGLDISGQTPILNDYELVVHKNQTKLKVKESDDIFIWYLTGCPKNGCFYGNSLSLRCKNVISVNGTSYDLYFNLTNVRLEPVGSYELKSNIKYPFMRIRKSRIDFGATMGTFDEINDNLSDTNIAKRITTFVDCEYMFIPSSYTGSFEQFLNEYREHYSDIPSIGGGIFTEPEEDPFKYKLDIIQKVVDVDIRKPNNPDNPESWTFGGQILREVTGDGNSWSGQITGLPNFGYKDALLHERARTLKVDGKRPAKISYDSDNDTYTLEAAIVGYKSDRDGYEYENTKHQTGINEKILTNGGYFKATNGGSVNFQGCDCSSSFDITVLANKTPPAKKASTSKIHPGETMSWSISQSMADINPVLVRNTDGKLKSMVFYDMLPAGLDYVSHSVTKNGVPVPGSFSNVLGRLTFTVDPAELRKESFYDGKPVVMTIVTKLSEDAHLTSGRLTNKGSVTTINTVSVTATTDVYVNIYTSKEGQGSITPDVLDLPWGNNDTTITYTPSKNWYTKEMHQGSQSNWNGAGSSLEEHYTGSGLKPKLASTRLINIKKNMHVHAVFVPIPELSVTKAIDGTKKYDAFGSPLFYYKVSGTDYLGDAHTWYWAIPGEGTVTRKVPAGDYTVRELPIDRWQLMKVENVKNFSGLSVEGRGGSCSLKNGLPTDAPGSSAGDGHVRFTNRLSDWEDSGHNSQAENRLK